jgi:hypothetical protein
MSQGADQGVPNPRGRKSVPWRRDPVILTRLRDVERRHLAGQTNVTIAEALDVDETTIRRDLERLRELWLERTKGEQENLRAGIVAELEDVRTRALSAAEFDERAERAIIFGSEPVAGGGRRGVQFRGNKAAALGQARQATMDKAKILGLEVNKVALTDSQGDDISLDELMERFGARQAEGGD